MSQATTPIEGSIDTSQCIELLARILSHHSGVAPDDIDIDQPLASMPDLESVRIIQIFGDIEEFWQCEVPEDFYFEAATLRSIAQVVAPLPTRISEVQQRWERSGPGCFVE